MDQFARRPTEERRLYFEQAAARLGLSAQIIEKDFWGCWSLRRLSSSRPVGPGMTKPGQGPCG
ncbi:MAG: hypothetical protein ABSG68_25190 [Thermoguttaceae bacterium]|jgi:hypothetical protein